MSQVRLEFNNDCMYQGVSCCMLNDTFLNVKSQQLQYEILRKCDQGKAILDGIEFRVSKITYKDICIKEHGLRGQGFVCPSVSLSILRSAIVANAFYSDLKTHKTQNFPRIAPRGVAKLRTLPKVTIFAPLVPYYFVSDHCLKGDC